MHETFLPQHLLFLLQSLFFFRIQIVDQLRVEKHDDGEQTPEGEIVQPQNILMVHTKNLVHEPFESTMDVKVSSDRLR